MLIVKIGADGRGLKVAQWPRVKSRYSNEYTLSSRTYREVMGWLEYSHAVLALNDDCKGPLICDGWDSLL